MEYAEALDIVARLQTHYQAYEKMSEVLKKAQEAENHVKELEGRRDGLTQAIDVQKVHLEETLEAQQRVAKEFEARLSQLKKTETAKKSELEDLQKKINKTKELARSVA